jgi:4-diphosphocytidyl-2-C-methyl-D-erythritol kinase
MRLYAPAKINWTLEVLGRRDDGYHEVRSVMQTVEPCDKLKFWLGLRSEVRGPDKPARDEDPMMVVEPGPLKVNWSGNDPWLGDRLTPDVDLVMKAADLLDPNWSRHAEAEVAKHIPLAAGLGGGSSDAAAALHGLNELWRLGYGDARLAEIGAEIGSDVAFFVYGGTALAEGRGERVTPLPDSLPAWLVLLVPPFHLPEKTRRMYNALTPADFTDGSRTEALLRRLRQGLPVVDEGLYNAFQRAAYEVFGGLEAYRDALLAAGARRVHLAGSGPALFALGPDEGTARAVHDRLRPPDGQALVVHTLTAAEARTREG